MRIGILAVQGDFAAHGAMLERLGVSAVLVKTPQDLAEAHGLILPGGESSTQLKFLMEGGLLAAIQRFGAEGGGVLGTCAGAILLARQVKNPSQLSLGLADIAVVRNAYGRQLASEVRFGACTLKDAPLEMLFIRAPVIESVGSSVAVLAESEGRPVLVQQGRILAATFHPELTEDATVHRHFLQLCGNGG